MATKLTLGFVFLVILITVFAQTPSFFGLPTPPRTDANSTGNKSVMSPEQFQNTVSSMNQQSMDQINQQLKQQHAEQRYPASPTVVPTPPTGTNTNEATSTNTTTTNSAPDMPSESPPTTQTMLPPSVSPPNMSVQKPPTSAPGQVPTPPTLTQPQPAPNSGTVAPPSPPQPPPNYGIQATPAKPGQTEIYTGFGAGQEKNTQQPPKQDKSSSGSSGGWNINY